MYGTALLLIVIVVVIMLLLKSARVVPENSAFVVERLGNFNRILNPGFHILTPFIERVAYRRTLKPEGIKLMPLKFKAADGRDMTITMTATLMVTDVGASCYKVDNYKMRASEAAGNILQDIAETFPPENLLAEKAQLEVNLQNLLDKTTRLFGVETTGFEITDIKFA